MTEIALADTGAGFVLTRGEEELATLSDDEVLALSGLAINLQQKIISRSYPLGAVFAIEVFAVAVETDALGEKALLDFHRSQSDRLILELSPPVARSLLVQLQNLSGPAFPSSTH